MQVTTVGLDLAKNVLQIHAVDAAGAVVVRKKLRREMINASRRMMKRKTLRA